VFMRGKTIRSLLLPLLLAAGLGACASNGVQPGIVYSSGAPSGAYGGGQYGSGPYGPGPQAGTYNSGGPYGAQRVSSSYPTQGGYPNQGAAYPNQGAYPNQAAYPGQASYPAQGSNYGGIGDSGRVVSVRDVSLAGSGGGGGNGALMGGILGAGAGATIGAITSQTLGGGIVGAVLGMVGGAIAGSIADGQRGAGRGIEVTVQKDDGQQVTVAQPDDGDIQLGDRVQVVQNRQGVAQVVRQTARSADTSGTFQPTQ
jgi:outer membrane lipoprotein SlyB